MSQPSTFTAPNGRVITVRERTAETRELLSEKTRAAILKKRRDMIARMNRRTNRGRK